MQVKKVQLSAEGLKHDEDNAKESREAMEAEEDEKKKAAKKLMLVPQNGKEVFEHMEIV
jgi:hypothetical protein